MPKNRGSVCDNRATMRKSDAALVAWALIGLSLGLTASACDGIHEKNEPSHHSPQSVEMLSAKLRNTSSSLLRSAQTSSHVRPKSESNVPLIGKSDAKPEETAPSNREVRDGELENATSNQVENARIRRFPAAGTLRGQVRKISESSISLGATNEKPQTLRGTPFTLGKMNRGDDVEIPFVWVGNRRWLTSPTEERPPLTAFAVHGHLRGPVTRLDRKRGVLGIGKLRLKAHPHDLRTIAIGQVLRVDFVEVDHRLWVHSAQAAWQEK